MLTLDMSPLTRLGKAFADPTRVRLLALLRGRELCVCELCDVLGVAQSTLSTHLQVIRDSGLVRTRKQGKWVYYAPAPETEALLEQLFHFFEKPLGVDPKLRRDLDRLKKRVGEREDGKCCRGFDSTQRRQT